MIYTVCALVSVIIVVVVLVDGIREKKDNEVDENLHYHLYSTRKRNEYLKFLEEFDNTNFEIVNITTVLDTGGYSNGASYMVTYKNK